MNTKNGVLKIEGWNPLTDDEMAILSAGAKAAQEWAHSESPSGYFRKHNNAYAIVDSAGKKIASVVSGRMSDIPKHIKIENGDQEYAIIPSW